VSAADSAIGVDVGGSFTDAVVITNGEAWRAKSPSTYPDVGRGVMEACRLAAAASGRSLADLLPDVARFGLGTTAITNVIATRSGLKVGLLMTKGFEEMLRLGRARMIQVDGWQTSPPPLVEQGAVVPVNERIDRNGAVLKAIEPDAVREAGRHLVEVMKVDSIAVSFLWSFINPAHERLAVELLRGNFPGVTVTSAAELRPVIREYERTTLAMLNAYSFGAFTRIEKLADELRDAGLRAPVLLCHSGGGTISIGQAREQPVWLAESGPAAGVTAAALLAASVGEDKALTCDLGGTSFDVSHIADASPARLQRGDLMGIWTALPRVDVESVGAGGGSIAWVDERRMLRVGPRSAGASPGPASYGRGGTSATLTDALLVLGYIDPARFLGGNMVLDGDAAVRACERVGAALGYDAVETAWGVREIALAEMAKAARTRLALHALSPREYPLISYGGCGSLFTADVALAIGSPRVLVPELASVLSAFGAATTDVRRERVRTLLRRLPVPAAIIDESVAQLRGEVTRDLAADMALEANRRVVFEADLRFVGQRWEVTVTLPAEPTLGDGGAQLEALFRDEYLRRYGPAATGAIGVVELVAIRAIGIGAVAAGELLRRPCAPKARHAAVRAGARAVRLDRVGAAVQVDVFDGTTLNPGDEITGPALVDGADTTVWIPGGTRATLDLNRTIVVEIGG